MTSQASGSSELNNAAMDERLSNARHFEFQVAGHAGLLALDDGLIVKPTNAAERAFYEDVCAVGHADEHSIQSEFRTFMPRYYGSLRLATKEECNALEASGASLPRANVAQDNFMKDILCVSGICIENITYGYCRPCVMDVKIGTQSWADDATPEKRARMEAKDRASTTATLGFRISGMTVYDLNTKEIIRYGREYGYSLNDTTIHKGFETYFSCLTEPSRRRRILGEFLEQLEHFLEVLRLADVRLRSASLLFVYEEDPEGAIVAREQARLRREEQRHAKQAQSEDQYEVDSEEDSSEDEDDDQELDLRLIDFARSYWQPGIGPDQGCIMGVHNIIHQIRELYQAIESHTN